MQSKILVSFLAFFSLFLFPVSAFAADYTFTSSNESLSGTNLNFHAASFSHSPATPWALAGITECHAGGCLNGGTAWDQSDFFNLSTGPFDVAATLNDGSYSPSAGSVYLFLRDNNNDNYFSQVRTFPFPALPTATPIPTSAFGGVINPTDQAKVNSAIKSIPDAAKAEVFAIFPVTMPYILLVISIGVAFFVVKFLMRRAQA